MKLIIFGPPGSGKGTQAKLISKDLKLKHIVASDILKKEMKKGSSLGKKIKNYISKGDLVPEKLIMPLIKKNLPKDNFILDGAPRDIKQAKELKKIFSPDFIFVLNVPKNILMKRLLERAKIESRIDDNPKTIEERFKVYTKQTKPVLNYYKSKIVNIKGDRSAEDIEKEILKLLK